MKIIFICFLIVSILCFDPLINQNSTQATKDLYARLVENYGKKIFSGQTNFHYSDLVSKVGRHPAVQAFDMQNYSPHNPWYNWAPYDDGTVDSAIKWYNDTQKKGIVSFHWHWFSPQGGQLRTSTFYTNYTNFNVERAVTPGTSQYTDTIRDFDAIATQLIKLKNANIPILWRPLHEADGRWFWWGSKTYSETLKLYNMMYDRFTNHHQINNLIWIWSSPSSQWYPGNNKIDMIGYDSYPGSYNYGCQTSMYLNLRNIVGGKKMIHLTQNGPIPDIQKCWQEGALWGYFLSWSDLVFSQNSDDHLQKIYKKTSLVVTIQSLTGQLEQIEERQRKQREKIRNSLRKAIHEAKQVRQIRRQP